MTETDRHAIRDAILACDQPRLDCLVFALGLAGDATETETEMRATLATAPHDVQIWWNGVCNCDGHLN
jgi:hypothetical protein